MKGKKVYLAIPYKNMEAESFRVANNVAAHFLNKGAIVYSPISQGHAISQEASLPIEREFWANIEKEFIPWCDELIIILFGRNGMKNIDNSKGCQAEIKLAKILGKKVDYFMYSMEDEI